MSEEKRKCPGCAEEIPANATVCEYCGEKFNSFLETEQTMEKPELYNPKAAANWSLLFTPIFGAYVIKSNWKMLGQEQREKRSRIWLITLSVIYIVAMFFLDESVAGLYLLPLAAWYFVECRSQIKYLTENRIDYQKKKWKSIALKAAGILVGIWALFIIMGLLFGEPTLDCSSNQAFTESGEVIVEYLKDDIGGEELGKKAQYGDLSKDEEALLMKFAKIVQFFNIYAPRNIPDAVVKKIDGMTASDLLDYVDEHYSLSKGGWLTRTKE